MPGYFPEKEKSKIHFQFGVFLVEKSEPAFSRVEVLGSW
jgi:hypothetical protein